MQASGGRFPASNRPIPEPRPQLPEASVRVPIAWQRRLVEPTQTMSRARGTPPTRTLNPTTQRSGYLKAVWLEIFGPVFPGFPAESDPRDPLDRRGPPRTSISTKNQPRRPILRTCRGAQKIRPDCLQVPRLSSPDYGHPRDKRKCLSQSSEAQTRRADSSYTEVTESSDSLKPHTNST